MIANQKTITCSDTPRQVYSAFPGYIDLTLEKLRQVIPMALISFTKNYRDKSTMSGFQFEFFCDACSTSHMTPFEYSQTGVASKVASAASILMGKGYFIGAAGEQINMIFRGKEWEEAYARAVEEAKKSFKRCPRCSHWICPDTCWNEKLEICRKCGPDLTTEAVAMQAQAGKYQMLFKAAQTDQTGGRELSVPQALRCSECESPNQGGAFCTDCGRPMVKTYHCQSCDTALQSRVELKFCPTCGKGLNADCAAEKVAGTEPGTDTPEDTGQNRANRTASGAAKTSKETTTSTRTESEPVERSAAKKKTKGSGSESAGPSVKAQKQVNANARKANKKKDSRSQSRGRQE